MKYPTKIKINGNTYKINTSFRKALKCFEIINDVDITDIERAYAVVYVLFGTIPNEDINTCLKACKVYLERNENSKPIEEDKHDFDINYDMKYIIPSFRSEYNIDINDIDMHYYEFLDLLGGLSEKSTLNRIRSIRNYNLAEIKDPKTRTQMAKAKESVALPTRYSKEEQELIDEFNKLLGL